MPVLDIGNIRKFYFAPEVQLAGTQQVMNFISFDFSEPELFIQPSVIAHRNRENQQTI